MKRAPWRTHPPGGNFLPVQKVAKNTFRGSAPQDPVFWEQGHGEHSFAPAAGSRYTYQIPAFHRCACRPVKQMAPRPAGGSVYPTLQSMVRRTTAHHRTSAERQRGARKEEQADTSIGER